MTMRSGVKVALLGAFALGLRVPLMADEARIQQIRKMTEVVAKRFPNGTSAPDSDFFKSKEFVVLWEHPKPYVNEVYGFIVADGVSETRKIIAVAAMLHLPPADYLKFINKLLSLHKAQAISENVFFAGSIPIIQWSTFLQDNYQNPKVRDFLLRAKPLIKDADKAASIDAILSGESARDVENMRAGNQLKEKPRRLPRS